MQNLKIHIMVILGESRLIQNDWETLAEGTTLRLKKNPQAIYK